MAKIYISYNQKDKVIVEQLSNKLKERGHSMVVDQEVLKVGQDWRKTLLDSLKESDGVIVVLTPNSLDSKYVLNELGAARAFVSTSNKFLIPIVNGDIDIPPIIQDLYTLRIDERNLQEVTISIDQAISSHLGKVSAEEVKENEIKQQLELKAADYVEVAINSLKRREVSLKWEDFVAWLG